MVTPTLLALHPMTPRRELYLQIATLVAGHRVDDVLGALADNLAQAAGFASASPDASVVLLRGMVEDMGRLLRTSWPAILEAKARANTDEKGGTA